MYLGATRPAMWFGLPIMAAVVLVATAYMIQVTITGWRGIVWAICLVGPAWIGARHAVARSPYGLNVVALWIRTSALCGDCDTWGGSSRSPSPNRPPVRPRGMRYVV
ncbi:VirB3 family type IV secretion system protein [Rhodovastum atsumiense]|uniref:VirB3 family type IV secretion system protein n=1 Tax=Rhodovastum atsumiense TaxID=504468 RepID=UPI00139F29D4|nr:VirB3 family type IV secretion system protein [Rhodovastum atsumiense]